jgi:hypothetical protein
MSVDPAFGVGEFGTPKLYSESETLANNIIASLFAVPGSYPTMPNFGMAIQDYCMGMMDDIDVDDLKSRLVDCCSDFSQVVNDGQFDVIKTTKKDSNGDDVPLLLLVIPTQYQSKSKSLIIGITKDTKNIAYNFKWIDED